ncbi:hypothetical protein NDA11_001558 [Ustilago hordei]|nr:hypothetical protein NDA10_006504 [Ustilago hordei]KAJ1586127.1 hypothetical protein NDA12_005132 [Ustilago hordei]KAJ1589034.1 hypothetical protein NDA15_001696 [Ustilago hordei]KAJ1590664.1 hypothetical protein NDA11_001558 [Ustilago hordei]KAJ1600675.1 hypothetical protein NDA14_002561 [Ustilago hordei]
MQPSTQPTPITSILRSLSPPRPAAPFHSMVRGHAKQAAQEAAKKKAAGGAGTGKSQLGEARQKGLKFTCPTCKGQSPNYKVLKEHFENKHPKETVPPESSFTA